MQDWPDGYGKRVLASIDSTNAEAARIADHLAGPEWILALEQTAGRGRRGRAWVNPVGNFAATLVLHPTEPPEVVALRSFVASLALYDAFVAVTGRPQGLSLKWPNDVLLNGGKVAGILLESVGMARDIRHIGIGIGVNLKEAPGADQVEEGALSVQYPSCRKPGSRCHRRSFWTRWPRPMPIMRRSSASTGLSRSAPCGWIARPVWVR